MQQLCFLHEVRNVFAFHLLQINLFDHQVERLGADIAAADVHQAIRSLAQLLVIRESVNSRTKLQGNTRRRGSDTPEPSKQGNTRKRGSDTPRRTAQEKRKRIEWRGKTLPGLYSSEMARRCLIVDILRRSSRDLLLCCGLAQTWGSLLALSPSGHTDAPRVWLRKSV